MTPGIFPSRLLHILPHNDYRSAWLLASRHFALVALAPCFTCAMMLAREGMQERNMARGDRDKIIGSCLVIWEHCREVWIAALSYLKERKAFKRN